MTLTEARNEAMARGFTHVKTYGGLVPIDEWTPYGGYDKVILTWDAKQENTMYGAADGRINGVWRFHREEVTP